MNIALFGASGMIGRRILDEALERGHRVRAIVRDPSRLEDGLERLTVEVGDILDPASVFATASGCDAVVYALHMRGKTNQEIVEALDLTASTVSRWINAAYSNGLMDELERRREFGTRLECTCREDPLDPDGPPIVCVNCCASSRDHNPRLHAPPVNRRA